MPVNYIFGLIKVRELGDKGIEVSRPGMSGSIVTHTIRSPYTAFQIATYLVERFERRPQDLIQNIFPDMKDEDREFLMTGITPTQWQELFGGEDE